MFVRRFPRPRRLQLFALLCAMMAGASNIQATTITVTTTADSGAGSLRDAIAAANDGDTIQFDAALNGQTINLTSGELAIDKDITISGPGPNLLAHRKPFSTGATNHFVSPEDGNSDPAGLSDPRRSPDSTARSRVNDSAPQKIFRTRFDLDRISLSRLNTARLRHSFSWEWTPPGPNLGRKAWIGAAA